MIHIPLILMTLLYMRQCLITVRLKEDNKYQKEVILAFIEYRFKKPKAVGYEEIGEMPNDYAKMHEANIATMSPTIDNTTTPPKGSK